MVVYIVDSPRVCGHFCAEKKTVAIAKGRKTAKWKQKNNEQKRRFVFQRRDLGTWTTKPLFVKGRFACVSLPFVPNDGDFIMSASRCTRREQRPDTVICATQQQYNLLGQRSKYKTGSIDNYGHGQSHLQLSLLFSGSIAALFLLYFNKRNYPKRRKGIR